MFSMLLVAASTVVAPQNQSQKAEMLHAIDNICGDTWCEGDYNFRFDDIKLSCKTQSATVKFLMFPYDTAEDKLTEEEFGVSCTIPGFYTYDQIMDSKDSLNWDFYLGLTDCIQGLEASKNKTQSSL